MSQSPASPTRVGKYRILQRVALGGTAEIYEARLDGIGGFQRTFAIKRILPHLSERPEFVDMLVEEAKIAGLLSHANIVQIMDLGQEGGACFIAMEYVRGPRSPARPRPRPASAPSRRRPLPYEDPDSDDSLRVDPEHTSPWVKSLSVKVRLSSPD